MLASYYKTCYGMRIHKTNNPAGGPQGYLQKKM